MSRIRTKVQANRKTRYYPLTRINGKETPLGGFRTKTDAVNVLKKAESEIAKGVFMVEMKKDPCSRSGSSRGLPASRSR